MRPRVCLTASPQRTGAEPPSCRYDAGVQIDPGLLLQDTLGADLVTRCLNAGRMHILSVGSGDGSQSAAVVQAGHPRITATFFDSRDTVLAKYPSAATHLEVLERDAEAVHFGVDATALGSGPGPLGQSCTARFDVILFYFPLIERCSAVASNRDLVKRFLEAAPRLLAPGGQVL